MGVAGGAWATIIGQFISFLIAVFYIPKMKSFKLKKKDFKITKEISKTLGLGLSSFITQMSVLALFVVMNNLMTRYGASSIYGSDIPLSVYGIMSKLNNLFVSSILGISIGAQPIIGYNYGAGNYERVKETLKKVLLVGLCIGIIFNILFYFFPSILVSIFISPSDPTYQSFMDFAIDFAHIFLLVCGLNFLEMTTSIVIQSLGKVKKATIVSFIRQIILFIPLAFYLSSKMGLYGALYAGPIADSITFVIALFIFYSEYKKLKTKKTETISEIEPQTKEGKTNYVITIAREYGSGGRYVGKLLADKLDIPFYDKEIIRLAAKESGYQESFIKENEESKNLYYEQDNTIFLAESKVIKEIAKKPCVIIGRCADYVLKNQKNVLKILLYSDEESKIKRIQKYYGIKDAKSEMKKIDRQRAKHYKYYTKEDWLNINRYDLAINVDTFGVEETSEKIRNFLEEKNLNK